MKNINPNSLPSLKTNYNHDKGRTNRAFVRTYYLCLNLIYFLLFIETPIESTRNDNFFCNIFLWSFVALQFRLTLVWYWLFLRQIWMLSLLALSPFQQLFSFFTFDHSYIGICSCSCFFSDNKQRAEEKDRKQNCWKRKQICVCVCVCVSVLVLIPLLYGPKIHKPDEQKVPEDLVRQTFNEECIFGIIVQFQYI